MLFRSRKLCETFEQLVVTESNFGDALFSKINTPYSTVNILIGSKKFTEGWSSWRVSTMGLMNIGRGEGSEIIQLFGRGVRLKGYHFSLKRSQHLASLENLDKVKIPDYISTLETLNIFGVRADYMQQFRDYLEKAGLPDQENQIEVILPVIKNLGQTPLKMIRVNPDFDFKTNAPKLDLNPDHKLFKGRIILDWYPQVQARKSQNLQDQSEVTVRHEGKLEALHLAFMNEEEIYQDLQRFKEERGWYNFSISRNSLEILLKHSDWYHLYIPAEELRFTSFSQVHYWQALATTLLKKYCDKTYRAYKSQCESAYLEIRDLRADDPNFIEEYRFWLDRSQADIIATLESIKEAIVNNDLRDFSFGSFDAIDFKNHLYRPRIYLNSKQIKVSPIQLNESEKTFVLDLRKYYEQKRDFFQDKELYLLRNQSRGQGIGFFDAGNFYPDFILWLIVNHHQYITFIDPKGLRNLPGESDPKIQFYLTIKGIETRLADPNITLNSFIVSKTPFDQIEWWGSDRLELEHRHVLFQEDSDYIHKLFLTMLNS